MEIGYKFFVEIVKMIEVLLKVGMGGGVGGNIKIFI